LVCNVDKSTRNYRKGSKGTYGTTCSQCIAIKTKQKKEYNNSINVKYRPCMTCFRIHPLSNFYQLVNNTQKRNAYVNNLRIGGTVTDEYRKYFTITNERYENMLGMQFRYVAGVIHLKNHDYTIRIHNNVVKELQKTLRTKF